ncbi:hypothetical protein D3C84_760210 [compost metagenome]
MTDGVANPMQAANHQISMRTHAQVFVEDIAHRAFRDAGCLTDVFGVNRLDLQRIQQFRRTLEYFFVIAMVPWCGVQRVYGQQHAEHHIHHLPARGLLRSLVVQNLGGLGLDVEQTTRQPQQWTEIALGVADKVAMQHAKVELIFTYRCPAQH